MTNVPPIAHLDTFILPDNRRLTEPPNARDANAETDVFWVAYVTTGYESAASGAGKIEDIDPNTEEGTTGLTDPSDQMSAIFLETIRDATAGSMDIGIARARVTVHEVGHQFGLVSPTPMGSSNRHRDDMNNIMEYKTLLVPSERFYFHPEEVADMRNRLHSPPG